MFRTSIAETPFSTDVADSIFHNIVGDKYGNDVSFLSTMRALIAPRIKGEEGVILRFGKETIGGDKLRGSGSKEFVINVCRNYNMSAHGQVIIHDLGLSKELAQEAFEKIKKSLPSEYAGYRRLEKVEAFYRKSFMVDCYINPELKSVIVFVDSMDYRKLHYLQVSILAFLPWYLNQEEGLTADEMALMESLRETTSDNYSKCIRKLSEKYDFKTARVRNLLEGIETKCEEAEIGRIQLSISDLTERISSLHSQIGDYIRDINEKNIRLLGLKAKVAQGSGDSEIMEYFLCNGSLVLNDVNRTRLYFSVRDYLEYFDRDAAEGVIENKGSYVYNYGRSEDENIWMERLMREIFVEEFPRLKVRLCASYALELTGNVEPLKGMELGYEFDGYTPNLHIDRYACMGNYVQQINESMMNGDYIGAIEQCIASCKSLNFHDATVMERFMGVMWNNEGRRSFIELPDGSVVSPHEAIEWLKQEDVE